MSFKVKPFSPYIDTINKKAMQMFEAGLFVLWFRKSKNLRDFKEQIDEVGPQVLTMDHLGVGFIICLIPLAISTVVFVIEFGIFVVKTQFHKP